MPHKVRLSVLSLLGSVFLMSPVWALDLKDLPGEWQGTNGLTYQISVNGNQVTIKSSTPATSSDRLTFFSARPFQGSFLPKVTKLQYKASTADFNPTFPMTVRQQLVKQGYTYRGDLSVLSETELRLKYVGDYVRWDKNKRVTDIDKDYSIDVVNLTKAPSYKIGSVRVDDQEFQRRIRAKVLELEADIRSIKQELLPLLNTQLQTLKQNYNEETKRVDGYWDQVSSLDQTAKQIKQEMTQLESALKQSPNWNQRMKLVESVRQLEDRILESHQAGRLEEVTHLFNRLEDQTARLKNLESKLEKELGSQKQINALLKQMNTTIAKRKALEEALVVSNPTGPALLASQQYLIDRLVDKTNEIQQQEQRIQYQEMQIAYYQRKPLITKISLSAAGQPKYEASVDKDEALLKQWADDIQYVDTQLQQTTADLQQITPSVAQADQSRQELRAELVEAAAYNKKRGDEIAALIWTNAKWRYGVELAGNSFDVVLSTLQGGPAGAFSELAQKTAEHFVLDQLSFKSFDESALKAQMYANSPSLHSKSDLMDFATSQLRETPLTMLKEGGLDALKRNTLKTARSQAIGQALSSTYADSGISNASKRLSDTLGTLDNSEKVYKKALQSLDKNLPTARWGLVESQRLNRDAIRKFVIAERAEMLRLDDIKKAEGIIKQSEKKLQKLKAGSLTSLGKAIGVNLLVDGLKASLQSRFDRQEEEAWMRYFESDIRLQTVINYFQKASNHYWNTMDTQIKLQEHHESLAYLREQLEKDRQEYLASIQKNGQFYIAQNKAFTAKEDPIGIELTLTGPVFQEAVFLKGLKQPPLQGQPATLTPPGSPSPVNSATLNTNNRLFRFPSAQLKSLQDRGDLSLEIYQK